LSKTLSDIFPEVSSVDCPVHYNLILALVNLTVRHDDEEDSAFEQLDNSRPVPVRCGAHGGPVESSSEKSFSAARFNLAHAGKCHPIIFIIVFTKSK